MFGPTIDDFGGFLARHRHGALQDELSAALDEASAAAQRTGRAATVRLTLTVGPGPCHGPAVVADDLAVLSRRRPRPIAA